MTALVLPAVLVATSVLSALLGAWCIVRETRLARADAAPERVSSLSMGGGGGGEVVADLPGGGARRSLFDDRPIAVRFLLYAGLCLCTGALAQGVGADTAATTQILIMSVAAAVLVECDLRWFLLPDAATALMALAALAPIVAEFLEVGDAAIGLARWSSGGPVSTMLGGAALGGILLYIVRAAFSLASGSEALGLGDVKLAAALGAILGAEDVLMTITVGAGATAALLMVQRWRARGETATLVGAPIAPLGAGLAIAGMMIHIARLSASA